MFSQKQSSSNKTSNTLRAAVEHPIQTRATAGSLKEKRAERSKDDLRNEDKDVARHQRSVL